MSRSPPGHHPAGRHSPRYPLRDHHRGRPGAAIRSIHEPRQGRGGADGRCRDLLRGTTRRVDTPLGTLYVTITEDDRGQPFEVFMSLGKAGGALMADVEALGRMISLALRSGIPIKEIHRQLRGISSDRVTGLGPNKVMSVPDAIGIALERWMIE